MEATYELCFDPEAGEALIYRSIPAGICGPFTEPVRCDSREAAERFAWEYGYATEGDWQAHANHDSAALAPWR